MKCHAGVKRCAWSFSGCIETRLDVGRNAERKYAISGSVFRAAFYY
ncbi:MAG: hypothetical protein NC485_10270 [Ruminococcus flavefaciens]|nr:hypothetical protein [Ruminococcus flavefaciens]MCM1059282.1 hypothetical protein [Eubacterium sp.]